MIAVLSTCEDRNVSRCKVATSCDNVYMKIIGLTKEFAERTELRRCSGNFGLILFRPHLGFTCAAEPGLTSSTKTRNTAIHFPRSRQSRARWGLPQSRYLKQARWVALPAPEVDNENKLATQQARTVTNEWTS